MKHRALFAIALGALSALGVTPAAAQDDDGDGGQAPTPAKGPASASAEAALAELEGLAGTSIAAAGSAPDTPYEPFPTTIAIGNENVPGTEEANTRVAGGVLASEIILNVDDVRSVAAVTTKICPNAQGAVSAKVTLSIAKGMNERSIAATVTGTSNDSAALTNVKVRTDATGAAAKLLEKAGTAILRQSEQAWRRGYCVKIDVSEGLSRTVKPKEKVRITATAKQRFDGSVIKSMNAKLTAGTKSVAPGSVSTSPAKFTYTGPDKKPDTGSVELKSVSKRGIGFANLEYTTAVDLKIDADHMGLWRLTTVKCGGPVGEWNIKGMIYEGEVPFGNEQIVFSLPKSLSSTWKSTGEVGGAGFTRPFNESGSVTYSEASDGKSGTLNLAPGGSVPVTFGTFCTDGQPPPG